MKVSKIKVRIDKDDNTYTEVEMILPDAIADQILYDIVNWKNNWSATVETIERYQKSEKKFLSNK